ncbi:hypothetical protein Tco_0825759, partial [Tanacetum coccineum]
RPTAFKYERPKSSKPWFASQVDVKNNLSKPVTPHYLPKVQESASVKPYHVIASRKSRNSSKNMLRFSSNDMVHNNYLEEVKKKTRKRFLRWVPTGKLFTSSTTKADSEPTNGSNKDITNQYECEQTLDVSAVLQIKSVVVTNRITHIVLSALRRSDIENKLAWLVLTEPKDSYKDGDGDTLFQQNKDCQGRMLASFQDDAKYEHVGQDIRSQDGKDDKDKQGKDLKISELKTKTQELNDKAISTSPRKHNSKTSH